MSSIASFCGAIRGRAFTASIRLPSRRAASSWLRAVGCGALRPLAADVAEVKRMFVRPEARRRGVARAMLARLEDAARGRSVVVLRIETGTRQPESIALYEAAGYRRIPCFGEYATDPYSVCYEKRLEPRTGSPRGSKEV